MRKIQGWHIGFALFVIIGAMAIVAPLLVILGVFDSKPKPRTVESIQKQIRYMELKMADLEAERDIPPLTEAEKKAMRLRGWTEEQIEGHEKLNQEINQSMKKFRQNLIQEYRKMIEKLQKELEERKGGNGIHAYIVRHPLLLQMGKSLVVSCVSSYNYV